MGELRSFQDLNAWQSARSLYRLVFATTKQFPREEVYSSVSQMRRAALSVASNLAEGYGRKTGADKLHFYVMSRGSITELQNQVILMVDVGLITSDSGDEILAQAEITHKLVVGLIKSTENKK